MQKTYGFLAGALFFSPLGYPRARFARTQPPSRSFRSHSAAIVQALLQKVPATQAIEDVEILLRGDNGDPVPFERGKVVVTLNLRKHTYFTRNA